MHRDFLRHLIVQPRRWVAVRIALPLEEVELRHVGKTRYRCQRLILGKPVDLAEYASDSRVDQAWKPICCGKVEQIYGMLLVIRSVICKQSLLRRLRRYQERSGVGKRIVFLFIVNEEKKLVPPEWPTKVAAVII